MRVPGGAAALVLVCASLAGAPLRSGIPALPPLEGDLQQEYDAYIAATEERIQREVRSSSYLWAEQSPERWERVRRGDVVVEPWSPQAQSEFGNGLLHDWIGAMFVPATTLRRVRAFLQDYATHRNYFRPEVIDSALVSHDGDHWRIRYRIVKRYIITVVVNTDQNASYTSLSATRLLSQSVSARIVEVKDAGEPGERELDSRKDTSIVWRLNTYWRLEEKDGGVFVECEAVILTRSAPRGLRWLVNPIIRTLPGASLAHVLEATRNGALGRRR